LNERTMNSWSLSVKKKWNCHLIFWLLETLIGLWVMIRGFVMYREDVTPLVYLT
jgi:hypothetical protein